MKSRGASKRISMESSRTLGEELIVSKEKLIHAWSCPTCTCKQLPELRSPCGITLGRFRVARTIRKAFRGGLNG